MAKTEDTWKQMGKYVESGLGTVCLCNSEIDAAQIVRDHNCHDELVEAARQVIWKLSHNTSPSGKGGDCRPGTVDRTDATVRMLEAALAEATKEGE